jgi:hypothetical protein
VLLELARLEARRMLGTPWLLLVVPVTWWVARSVLVADWSGVAYQGLPTVATPALAAVSIVVALACSRDRRPLAQDAPVDVTSRTVARLLAGSVLVVAMAAVVAVLAVWLRVHGGLVLGDEPGRTEHAQPTLPELLQPVLLTAVAVALGAAVARWVRNRLGAAVVLFVLWFASTIYWLFNGPVLRVVALVQAQPIVVRAAPGSADPASLPAHWLLSAPGQYQDYWGRVVVSPALAAWHDVYLLGLTGLLAGLAVGGRRGRLLAGASVAVAVLGVVLQKVVHP